MSKEKNIKIIDVPGNSLAKEDFALVQIGNRDIGKGNTEFPFAHYYYEEDLTAKDFFIELYDLAEHYQKLKIVY